MQYIYMCIQCMSDSECIYVVGGIYVDISHYNNYSSSMGWPLYIHIHANIMTWDTYIHTYIHTCIILHIVYV